MTQGIQNRSDVKDAIVEQNVVVFAIISDPQYHELFEQSIKGKSIFCLCSLLKSRANALQFTMVEPHWTVVDLGGEGFNTEAPFANTDAASY